MAQDLAATGRRVPTSSGGLDVAGRYVSPWDIDTIVSELKEARGRSKRVVSASNRRAPLPSPEKLLQFVSGIYASLFPRHAGAFDHSDEGLVFYIGNTLNSALHILIEQVRR